ncbi:RDD family protein [Dendrosporobacter sp. 1207_IL3150]|uniref:RDD family protein n=1 Tax=Dendrosporobacter sp. 1207_IL3150 TaxID=3084054 RepID=UPI002FD93439
MNNGNVTLVGAGVGVRFVAILIDGLIFLPVSYLVAAIFGTTISEGFTLEGIGFYITMLLSFAYYIYFEGVRGATIGKLIIGLKVVKLDGTPCDTKAAVVRTVARIIDGLPFAYLLGALSIWVSVNNQRIGDRLAGTIVVRK